MTWKIPIGRLFGLQLSVRPSLLVGIALVGVATQPQAPPTSGGAAEGIARVVAAALVATAVFASVLAHALGHALVRRRFGVGTIEAELGVLGGSAIPARERDDLAYVVWTSLGGPAVNLAVGSAALAASLLWPYDGVRDLGLLNLGLGLVNLLPLYPADGAHITEAALSRWMGRARATTVVARLSRLAGVGAVVIGFYEPHLWLVLAGLYVFGRASGRERVATIEEVLVERSVRDAMVLVRRAFDVSAPLEEIVDALRRDSGARAFPVLFGDRPLGIIQRDRALAATRNAAGEDGPAQGGALPPLASLLDRQFVEARPDEPLRDAVTRMSRAGVPTALVVDGGEIVGLLSAEDVVGLIRAQGDRAF